MTTTSFEKMSKLETVRAKAVLFGWKIVNDLSFSLASLLAYSILLALLPLLLAMFAMASLIFGNDPKTLEFLQQRLTNAFPEQGVTEILSALLNSLSHQAGIVFFASFIAAIFTSSRLFVNLDDVLAIIYRSPERTILQQNFHAIKLLLVFIFVTPIIIVISSIPAIISNDDILISLVVSLSSGIIAFILIGFIYFFVPERKMSWKNIWCGALIASIGLHVLLRLFPLYVHQFMTNYVGQLGFIIIALVLFYVLGLLVVIGAQINAFFFEDIQPFSVGLITCLREFADQETLRLLPGNSPIQQRMSVVAD